MSQPAAGGNVPNAPASGGVRQPPAARSYGRKGLPRPLHRPSHGSHCAFCCRLIRWKAENLTTPVMHVLQPIAQSRWMASSEMPDGEWATQFCPIGMHCGFSLSGHPVRSRGRHATPRHASRLPRLLRRLLSVSQTRRVACRPRRAPLRSRTVRATEQIALPRLVPISTRAAQPTRLTS